MIELDVKDYKKMMGWIYENPYVDRMPGKINKSKFFSLSFQGLTKKGWMTFTTQCLGNAEDKDCREKALLEIEGLLVKDLGRGLCLKFGPKRLVKVFKLRKPILKASEE